jgi:hypothetical protein
MGTITRRIRIGASTDEAWAALADPSSVNRLLTFLGPITVEGDRRTCSLGDQGTLEELLVASDPDQRRVAYSITSSPFGFAHHHASMEIIDDRSGANFVWTTDFLPDSLRAAVEPVIEMGVASIQQALGTRELA